MKIISTPLPDLYVIETINFQDNRGSFQKLFNKEFFVEHNLEYNFSEFYYSVNHQGVIRGMHFQLPPNDHTKLVYVSQGEILDVVIDLRKGSTTYGLHFEIKLNEFNAKYLYIPKGFAHGFASMKEGSIVNYAQTSCYVPQSDYGIRFDSCGINWPIKNPTVSKRDLSFEKLIDFKSPF